MSVPNCINFSNPTLAKLATDFGEVLTANILENYFPNSIPTINEFKTALARINRQVYYSNSSKDRIIAPFEEINRINQDEIATIGKLLPKAIAIDLIPSYSEVLKGGYIATAKFQDGIITLSSNAIQGTAFHEAFHAVYRTMLSDSKQKAIMNQATKLYAKPNDTVVNRLKEQYNISDEEAVILSYEEMLADEFAEYMKDTSSYNSLNSGIRSLFDTIIQWIKNVFSNKVLVKQLFEDVAAGKFVDKEVNLSRSVTPAYQSLRFEGLTADEVRDITRQLAYITLKDIDSIQDIRDINGQTATENINLLIAEIEDNIDKLPFPEKTQEVLDKLLNYEAEPDEDGLYPLTDFWKDNLVSYMSDNLNIKVKSSLNKEKKKALDDKLADEDGEAQDELTNKGFLKSSFETSAQVNATSNIKFMISSIPKLDIIGGKVVEQRSQLTGFPMFNDFGTTWNLIQKSLSGIVPLHEVNEEGTVVKITDTYELMVNKLLEDSISVPELKYVLDRLNKADESVRSEFTSVFSMHKGIYQTLLIDKGAAVQTKITTEDVESKERAILERWGAEFALKFGTKEGRQLVYNQEAINNFAEVRSALQESINNDLRNKNLTTTTKKLLVGTFKALGITLDSKTYLHMFNERSFEIEDTDDNRVLIAVDSIVNDIIRATNTLVGAGRNSRREGELNETTNQILDEKSVFKNIFARAESIFDNVKGEAMFRSAGGPTWVYQDHNSMSLIQNQINNGDLTHVNNLLNSHYSKFSLWANTLASNPEARKNFNIILYGNNKVENAQDAGSKANDLKKFDQLHDVLHRQLNGTFIGLAEADKGQQSYIKGFSLIKSGIISTGLVPEFTNANPVAIKVFMGYLKGEIERARAAKIALYGDSANGIPPLAEEKLIPNYHYYIDPSGVRQPGGAFYSYIFPNIDPRELDLVDDAGNYYPTESVENYDNNIKLIEYIKNSLISNVKKDIKDFKNAGIIGVEGGAYINKLISPELLTNRSIVATLGDYSINALIGNIEFTMMFTGDPAFYKMKPKWDKLVDGTYQMKPWAQQDHFSDFMKRIPAAGASGKLARIFNNNDGSAAVRSTYSSAVIANIMTPSTYFGNDDNIRNIVDNLNKFDLGVKLDYEDIKDLLSSYKTINQTDAQAWISLKTYRERMRAYGRWNPAKESVYQQIIDNEIAIAEGKQIKPLSFADTSLLMQPLKTVHFQLKKTPGGMMVPHFNKQSEAPLLPFMTRGTELDNLRVAMDNNDIDHVIVLDGKKVGGNGITRITDENGRIKATNEITFNPTQLDYSNLFLQQDLTPHGVGPTVVGSQTTKNILGTVNINAKYLDGTLEGVQAAFALEDAIAKLSDFGLKNFQNSIGYDDGIWEVDEKTGRRKVINKIIDMLRGEVSDNQIEALEKGIIPDALTIPQKLQSKISSLNTKSVVKLKQNGGAFIQLSNFGFIGSEVTMSDEVKNGIIWFQEPQKQLEPMQMNADGTTSAAKVLLPYNTLTKLLSDKGIDIANMSSEDIMKHINPNVLKGLSYRIPNQAAGSNDAFEIVGILPPQAGDTIVMYSEITAKTGSDFDIDKAYIILPEFYWDDKLKQVRLIQYDPNNETEAGLKNRRLSIMREILLNPLAYLDVMAPLDNDWFEILAKNLFKEVKDIGDMSFFRGVTQLNNKNTFDMAKNLVGSIANVLSHHNASKAYRLGLREYLGKGTIVDGRTQFDTNAEGLSFDEDGNSIAITLSAFMNAIVDAAKDPFIARSNINMKTANTAFMLARAGVEREWIVAFIGQPILRDFIELMDNTESRFTDKSQGALDLVLKKYGIKYEAKDIQKLNLKNEDGNVTISTQVLIDSINGQQLDLETNSRILGQFLQWRDNAKYLNEALKVNKVDVEGSGGSMPETMLMYNSFLKVVKDNVIVNFDKMMGYNIIDGYIVWNTEGPKSMMGTYFQNAVLKYREAFEGFFLSTSPAVERSINRIAARSGYTFLTNNEAHMDITNKLSNELQGLIRSKSDVFNISMDEVYDIFYGNDTKKPMYQRLLEAKQDPNLKNNLLVKSLEVEAPKGDLPGKVLLPNNETTKDAADFLFIAGEELLLNDKEFAEDLFKYSFYSTGFNSAMSSFHSHIPSTWLDANGFTSDIKAMLDNVNNDINYLEEYEDTIIQNLYIDNKLVPTVSNKDIQTIKFIDSETKINTKIAFKLTQSESSQGYIAGMSGNNTVYKRFVKRQINLMRDIGGELVDSGEKVNYLYQLQGYLKDNDGNSSAIYVRINTKGINERGIRVKEFSTEDKSVFTKNNMSPQEQGIKSILMPYFNGLDISNEIPTSEYVETIATEDTQDTELQEQVRYCKGLI